MELDREFPSTKVSVFEDEMRKRLGWQIVFLDCKAAQPQLEPSASASMGNISLPLNINDSDLYPGMRDLPLEHTGPTEMIYCLIMYEAKKFLQNSPYASTFGGDLRELNNKNVSLAVMDNAIDDFEETYQNKHLKYCDPQIPLHLISVNMVRIAISSIRFVVHHPRQYPDKGAGMSAAENDMMFLNSVSLNEYGSQIRKTQFVQHILWHISEKSQRDAFVYIISELPRRTTENLVERA
jgi:hypothetical protein